MYRPFDDAALFQVQFNRHGGRVVLLQIKLFVVFAATGGRIGQAAIIGAGAFAQRRLVGEEAGFDHLLHHVEGVFAQRFDGVFAERAGAVVNLHLNQPGHVGGAGVNVGVGKVVGGAVVGAFAVHDFANVLMDFLGVGANVDAGFGQPRPEGEVVFDLHRGEIAAAAAVVAD